MGTVWRGRDYTNGNEVAVKVMAGATRGLANFEERFAREAASCAAVSHRHVVAVLDHGTTPDRERYLVMELLEGESLGTRIERLPIILAHDALLWIIGALEGLEAVHAAGIVHRDLKPDNLFLARDRDGLTTVKLVDFGVSLWGGDSDWDALTRSGEVLGTAGYMSPEQRLNAHDVDGRADLYSIGVVLYEALAGRSPFAGNDLREIFLSAAEGRTEPLVSRMPAMGSALSDVVMRALSNDPRDRFKTAHEMREALVGVRAGIPPELECAPHPNALRAKTRGSLAAAKRPLREAIVESNGSSRKDRTMSHLAAALHPRWRRVCVAMLAVTGALVAYVAFGIGG
jgi:serine/threonine-protein kinase